MPELISRLEKWNEEDSKARAVLRRSLSFDPGCHPPAFPYVEWSLNDTDGSWKRTVHYLVAGLWAQHWREGRGGEKLRIGAACMALQQASGSASIERRFIALLDSDDDQLPHRLRQMVSLLKEYPLDFDCLLKELLYWNNDEKGTQQRWARDFYRDMENENEIDAAKKEITR